MKKIILIPTNPDQKPVDLFINRYAVKKNHIQLVFPDGDIKMLPRAQVKEFKVIEIKDMDDDSHSGAEQPTENT